MRRARWLAVVLALLIGPPGQAKDLTKVDVLRLMSATRIATSLHELLKQSERMMLRWREEA